MKPESIDEKLSKLITKWVNTSLEDYPEVDFIRDIKALFEPPHVPSPSLAEPKREIQVGDTVRLERFDSGDIYTFFDGMNEHVGKEYEVQDIYRDQAALKNCRWHWLLSAVTLVQPSQTKQEKMEFEEGDIVDVNICGINYHGFIVGQLVTGEYLFKTKEAGNLHIAMAEHITKESPATELQSLLKDPNVARAIEIFKQLEK